MKKILSSFAIIAVVGAIVAGATGAFYSDTETSTGNIFTAGSIDLKVDHTHATYDGQPCVSNCTETGSNLIVNGGFETPVVTDNGGTYQLYPNATQTSWTVESGPGLEIQRNSVAGAPHNGVQLAELDSTASSSISQTITTVAGGKYRLHFWHSPRPNNPANDNAIAFTIQVVSPTSTIFTDIVEASSAGGSNTVWTEYVYDFIAVSTSTKIIFTDAGSLSNTYGGYLDDVSMFTLNCTETGFPNGGQCHLWNEKDLGPTDQFWYFPDVKPGDNGTDTVSLHVNGNDAFACLYGKNIVDTDVTLTGPEIALGDTLATGELSPFIKVFGWNDANGDGIYQGTEATLITVNTPLPTMVTQMVALSLTGGGPTKNVGLAWCAGTQTLVGNTIGCDGAGMSNIAQTDKTTLDFTAYAVQQRNNPNFTCASLVTPPEQLRTVSVNNLQPSYTATGGGGVYSGYSGPDNNYVPISPGSTAVYDTRQAGIIKAGQGTDPGAGNWDDGIFAVIPNVTINALAAGALTYDVETQFGVNPVWMTIEIDTGVVGTRTDNTIYQFVPTTNPAGWHTVDAGAGLWQKWNNGAGDTTGNPLISLSAVAAANTGKNVVRTNLRLGMGSAYYNGGTGTTAWVDKMTIGGVTYDFVSP